MATHSHTGDIEPFGITTVLPIVKSVRGTKKP
jgi:hypothetical protein